MGFKTPLYSRHREAGARIVDFSGWDMPLHYGSQIEEHHLVRGSAGVFDVSHMTVVDLGGRGAADYLRTLLANDVAVLDEDGKALYSAMLNESGTVLDDLITYRMDPGYRVVVNCATREKDLEWMHARARGFDVTIEERPDLAMLAVQGPEAHAQVKSCVDSERSALIDRLKLFQGLPDRGWFIARTGYTGERGLELILGAHDALDLWDALLERGVRPIGLAARDSLRLEAGMNLYGSDMDETVTPLESNMARTVIWEPRSRAFVGRAALEKQRAEGVPRELVGLLLPTRGVLRAHQKVYEGAELVGEITSGTFSPTLGNSIALARLTSGKRGELSVEIRDKRHPVHLVTTPFVRNGKRVYKVVTAASGTSSLEQLT